MANYGSLSVGMVDMTLQNIRGNLSYAEQAIQESTEEAGDLEAIKEGFEKVGSISIFFILNVSRLFQTNFFPYNLEWQVFRDMENTGKLQKLSTKRKTQIITENIVFSSQKQKNKRKSLFLRYFKVTFIIINLLTC